MFIRFAVAWLFFGCARLSGERQFWGGWKNVCKNQQEICDEISLFKITRKICLPVKDSQFWFDGELQKVAGIN